MNLDTTLHTSEFFIHLRQAACCGITTTLLAACRCKFLLYHRFCLIACGTNNLFCLEIVLIIISKCFGLPHFQVYMPMFFFGVGERRLKSCQFWADKYPSMRSLLYIYSLYVIYRIIDFS